MSLGKIRKVSPVRGQLRTQTGPGSAAIEWNDDTKIPEVSPDGTYIGLAQVVISNSTPNGNNHYGPMTFWLRSTGPTLYVNMGTYASPDWNTITQV